MRRGISLFLTSVLVASGISLGVAGPAQAAYPTCNGVTDAMWTSGTGSNTAALPSRYPSDYSVFNCLMSQGANNAGVRFLKDALNECYDDTFNLNSAESSNFSTYLRSHLIALQADLGITADGIYGPATRAAMKWPTPTGCKKVGATLYPYWP